MIKVWTIAGWFRQQDNRTWKFEVLRGTGSEVPSALWTKLQSGEYGIWHRDLTDGEISALEAVGPGLAYKSWVETAEPGTLWMFSHPIVEE